MFVSNLVCFSCIRYLGSMVDSESEISQADSDYSSSDGSHDSALDFINGYSKEQQVGCLVDMVM